MKIDVVNIEAKKAGNIELNPEIFGLQPRVDILSRVIEWQLSKRRSGNHKTKEVGDVKGSTKKIYRQKGTGNARHGSKRQVQFRGGCVAFGPVVRSHAYSLPKKVRKLGLKIALSAKAQAGELLVVDSFKVESGKTKDLLKVISTLNAPSAPDETRAKAIVPFCTISMAVRSLPVICPSENTVMLRAPCE